MQTYALAIMLILLRFSSIGFSSCSRFCCFRCSSFTDARSFPTSSKFMPLIFSPIQSFSSSHIFWNSSMLNTHTHTHTHTHTGRGGLVVVQRERSRDRTPLPTKVFFHENHCDMQLWAWAAHLLLCLCRLIFHPLRDGK